jgi:hypothetical protein
MGGALIALLVSTFVTCLAALSLGQAVLRICRTPQWSWVAAPVGLATLMLLATPARWAPGRATTTAVVIGISTVASFIWLALSSRHRPPLAGLVSVTPVLLLALIPFAASGRAGTLGVSFDNDMSLHLPYVEALMSRAAEHISGLQAAYPIGPHSVVAAICAGLGIRPDLGFAGFTVAVPLIGAWTAQHSLRRPTRLAPVLIATVVALPYLAAAYYGEGAFKEIVMAALVVGLTLWLDRPVPASGLAVVLPPALLVAGMLAVYSGPGLVWPAALFGMWVVGRVLLRFHRDGARTLMRGRHSRPLWLLVILVIAVFFLLEYPVVKNSLNIFHDRSALGNLVGPLPVWEAFGVWNNPDFRFGATSDFVWWTAFVVVLVIFGAAWSIRERRWILPAAAGASMLIWAYSSHYESPYLSAKALVILSPLLLLLAALPLVDRSSRPNNFLDAIPSAVRWAVPAIIALVLWVRVVDSDVQALRLSPVGSDAHAAQLRELHGLLRGQPVLFLGNDDFIVSELDGQPVSAAVIGVPVIPLMKPWAYGQALDIDSVSAATINKFKWVITTRDAAQSGLPPQLHLVRETPDFQLWHRSGNVAPRMTLDEGPEPGALLRCTASVRRRMSKFGRAAIRRPPVSIPVGGIPPGKSIAVRLSLSPGAWDLGTPYYSRLLVIVSGRDGVIRRLPPNLDRPGPRWPIGRVVVPRSGSITLTMHAEKTWLTPFRDAPNMIAVIATPVGTERVVPLSEACGRYVDWYTNPVPLDR